METRNGISYQLIPTAELRSGDVVVVFGLDDTPTFRTVATISPGEAHIGGPGGSTHVTGTHVTYQDRDRSGRNEIAIAGDQSRSARVVCDHGTCHSVHDPETDSIIFSLASGCDWPGHHDAIEEYGWCSVCQH